MVMDMEETSDFATRTVDHFADVRHITRREGSRTLLVTAAYRLSEEGRKLSLLEGGDGRADQEVKVAVPTNRFHLVSVDADGTARLKLQPWYYLDTNQNVARNHVAPTYDTPPTVEDLLRDAAKNHQLERAYLAEQAEARNKRRESQFEVHQRLAEQFLADSNLRALEHPKPTPRQCYLPRGHRPLLFDAKTGHGLARQVPPEAYRRFCEDLRARTERNREKRARELAVHDEKQRLIAEWVARRGTPDQQDRHAAGALSVDEALEGLSDEAFVPAGERPRYVRDGVERLQTFLRQFPEYRKAIVTKLDLVVTSANCEHATEAQWALKKELQDLLPDFELTLRLHRLAWKKDPNAPTLTQFGVLVTRRVGPFTLRREYLLPDG